MAPTGCFYFCFRMLFFSRLSRESLKSLPAGEVGDSAPAMPGGITKGEAIDFPVAFELRLPSAPLNPIDFFRLLICGLSLDFPPDRSFNVTYVLMFPSERRDLWAAPVSISCTAWPVQVGLNSFYLLPVPSKSLPAWWSWKGTPYKPLGWTWIWLEDLWDDVTSLRVFLLRRCWVPTCLKPASYTSWGGM